MRFNLGLWTGSALLCVGVVVGIVSFGINRSPGNRHQFELLQALSGIDEVEIELMSKAQPGGDAGPSLYYQVRKAGQIITGPNYFGTYWSDQELPRFALVRSSRPTLLGVTEMAHPTRLDLILDLEAGKFWPAEEVRWDIADELLDTFRKSSNNPVFQFGRYNGLDTRH